MLSTRNFFCWKFATFCWNSVENLQCLWKNCNFWLCLFFDSWRHCSLVIAIWAYTIVLSRYQTIVSRSTRKNQLKLVSKTNLVVEERVMSNITLLNESFAQCERTRAVSTISAQKH